MEFSASHTAGANTKCIEDLNVRPETIEQPEECSGKTRWHESGWDLGCIFKSTGYQSIDRTHTLLTLKHRLLHREGKNRQSFWRLWSGRKHGQSHIGWGFAVHIHTKHHNWKTNSLTKWGKGSEWACFKEGTWQTDLWKCAQFIGDQGNENQSPVRYASLLSYQKEEREKSWCSWGVEKGGCSLSFDGR